MGSICLIDLLTLIFQMHEVRFWSVFEITSGSSKSNAHSFCTQNDIQSYKMVSVDQRFFTAVFLLDLNGIIGFIRRKKLFKKWLFWFLNTYVLKFPTSTRTCWCVHFFFGYLKHIRQQILNTNAYKWIKSKQKSEIISLLEINWILQKYNMRTFLIDLIARITFWKKNQKR